MNLLLFCATAQALGTMALAPGAPEQVHLSVGPSPSVMGVQWATLDGAVPPPPTNVQWSSTPFADAGAAVSNATGTAHKFTVDANRTWYNHVANMTGLQGSTRYYYRVGSDAAGWSQVFHFTSQPTEATLAANLPQHHLVFGDMGAACAFTICPGCSCNLTCDASTCAANASVGLVSEVGTATHIVHAGDFAYNLADGGGTVGDQFFRNIEQLAAYVPYMVSIGNHEDAPNQLAHFTERFRAMPSQSSSPPTQKTTNGVAPNNWWFSWDDGLVHYVAISTEVYFGVPGVGASGPIGSIEKQYKWLEADLKAANANRANVPWIVVHGHRSLYCSCDGDCDGAAKTLREGGPLNRRHGLEQLFFEQGVDFFLNGHEHNYERMWPTYKGNANPSNVEPNATIYIVTGAAGCSELHEPFTEEQPPRSAFRSNTFGYSRFIVHNHSHVHWQQVITDPGDESGRAFFGGVPPYGSVIDDTWIVQSRHGPFDPARAPTTPGECTPETCVSFDHWDTRIRRDLPRNDSKQTVELIGDFRNQFGGEGRWLRAELNELDEFRRAFGNAAKWEDVRGDGSSDGHWEAEGMVGP